MTDWLRTLVYGVKNVLRFLPVVWRFRPWDYTYSYHLLMRGLELMEEHIREHQLHEAWERDAESIRLARERWRLVRQYGDPRDEEHMWGLLHDHLKRNGRAWWC